MSGEMTDAQVADLRLMMTAALVAGRREVDIEASPVFEAWRQTYPDDALGPLCLGLAEMQVGNRAEGIELIETATRAATRSDQARDVLADLETPEHADDAAA